MNKCIWLLAITSLFLYTACRRTFVKSKPVAEKPALIIKEMQVDYFQSKAKIDYDDGTNQFSSPMTIRIRRDSVIWISVNPALGIEVVRCLITRDSIFVINKIQKESYALGIRYVNDKFGVDMDFKSLQAILLGNMVLPYRPPIDSISITGDYAIVRQLYKNMELSNSIGKSTHKIEALVITDIPTKNNITVKYSDFNPLDSGLFAYTHDIVANYNLKQGLMKSNIKISHIKVDTKDRLRFPFNVPNRYERK